MTGQVKCLRSTAVLMSYIDRIFLSPTDLIFLIIRLMVSPGIVEVGWEEGGGSANQILRNSLLLTGLMPKSGLDL